MPSDVPCIYCFHSKTHAHGTYHRQPYGSFRPLNHGASDSCRWERHLTVYGSDGVFYILIGDSCFSGINRSAPSLGLHPHQQQIYLYDKI